MGGQTSDDAGAIDKGRFDPYQLDPSRILEPPTAIPEILKKIGPGIILSASIVGSGELIATTTFGAEVGYTVMWLILFSCLIKALVQSFLGRYTIACGETGLEAFNRIPGKLGRVNWVVWGWAAMVAVTLFQNCAMFIGVSQAMKLVTGIEVVWWVLAFFVLTLVLLLGGAYQRIERLAMVKVGLFTLITLLSAVVLTACRSTSPGAMFGGASPSLCPTRALTRRWPCSALPAWEPRSFTPTRTGASRRAMPATPARTRTPKRGAGGRTAGCA